MSKRKAGSTRARLRQESRQFKANLAQAQADYRDKHGAEPIHPSLFRSPAMMAMERAGLTAEMVHEAAETLRNDYAGFTAEQMQATMDRARERAEQEAAEIRRRRQALIESIPVHLQDTPEAKLMIDRVVTSWSIPVHPAQAKQWFAEWKAFLDADPGVQLRNAASKGLWVPGAP